MSTAASRPKALSLLSFLRGRRSWLLTGICVSTGIGLAVLAARQGSQAAPPPPPNVSLHLVSTQEASLTWDEAPSIPLLPRVQAFSTATYYLLESALDPDFVTGRTATPVGGTAAAHLGTPSGASEAWHYRISACNRHGCSQPVPAGTIVSLAAPPMGQDVPRAIVAIWYCDLATRDTLCIEGHALPSASKPSLNIAEGVHNPPPPASATSCLFFGSMQDTDPPCHTSIAVRPVEGGRPTLTVFVTPYDAVRVRTGQPVAASVSLPARPGILGEMLHHVAPQAWMAVAAFLLWAIALLGNLIAIVRRTPWLRTLLYWGILLYTGLWLILLFWNLLRRLFRSPEPSSPWTARFAAPAELSNFAFASTKPLPGDAIPLAMVSDQTLLAVQPGQLASRELPHVLSYAPTRSGKSVHAIACLLSWDHSAIVVDPKGEIWEKTAGYVQSTGRQALRVSPGMGGVAYDPWGEATTDAELRALAEAVAPAYTPAGLPYAEGTQQIIVALSRLARRLQQPTAHVLAAALQLGPVDALKALYAAGGEHREDAVKLANLAGTTLSALTPDRVPRSMLGQAWSGFSRSWDLLSDGATAGAMAGSSLTPSLLREQATVIYLHVPLAHADRYAPWLRLITVSLIRGALRRHGGTPLLVLLDEAGIIGLPALPDLLAHGAGQGVTFVVYAQARSQLERWYGREGLAALEANARCKLIWPTQDYGTAEHVSRMLGRTTVLRYASHGYAEAPRELLTPDEFMKLPGTSVLVLMLGLPPVIGQRIEWWRIPWMQERSSPPPPVTDDLRRADLAPLLQRLRGLARGVTFGKS